MVEQHTIMPQIRIEALSNSEEHYIVDGKDTRLEDGTFKNNGHTAVLIII